jgi:hypothetical protein
LVWQKRSALLGTGLDFAFYTNGAYGPSNEQGWAESQRLLGQMTKTCRDKGVAFHLAIWPMLYSLSDAYPFLPAHQAVAEACRKTDIPMLDLLDRLKAHPTAKLIIHPNDSHPNKLACRLAAEAIHEYLRRQHSSWFR